MRCGQRVASPSAATSSISTANSSPPKRATVSPGRTEAAQPLGHLDQQLVAGGVAEAVVDLLEAVEVEEQHRPTAASAATAPASALLDPVAGTARGWPARSASRGTPAWMSCSSSCLALADVAGVEHQAADARVVSRLVIVISGRHRRPVGVAQVVSSMLWIAYGLGRDLRQRLADAGRRLVGSSSVVERAARAGRCGW